MARITIRLIASPKDANAFAEFLGKVASAVPTALEIVSSGANKRSRGDKYVLRYMEVEFNTDDYERSGLKH